MTPMTLSTSFADSELSAEADRYLSMLGMKRSRLADYVKTMSVVRSHNLPNGRRLLDVTKRGFSGFRRAYGSSLGWIAGDYSTSGMIDIIADHAGSALRAFFRGDNKSGVIVLERLSDEHSIILQPREFRGTPSRLLDENHSLLLPTGITSPRLGYAMLYERIDLGVSYDPHTQFSVRDVLFTGADGESIAGIGDVNGMFVEHLRDLLPALYNVLGEDYNLLDINARIFSAVQHHELYGSASGEIVADIFKDDGYTPSVSVAFGRTGSRTWNAAIIIGGKRYPLAAVAPKRKFTIRAQSVVDSRRRLVPAFTALKTLAGAIDFDSVFAARHLERFPLAFRKLLEEDPEAAKQKFLEKADESLARFRSDTRHWKLIPFSSGREKQLFVNGASTHTDIQLCAPVFLTDEDERLRRASVYAVAELTEDGKCVVPSVLDCRMAIADINNLIRGVRLGLETAA